MVVQDGGHVQLLGDTRLKLGTAGAGRVALRQAAHRMTTAAAPREAPQ
jgi:hypothetical protein